MNRRDFARRMALATLAPAAFGNNDKREFFYRPLLMFA